MQRPRKPSTCASRHEEKGEGSHHTVVQFEAQCWVASARSSEAFKRPCSCNTSNDEYLAKKTEDMGSARHRKRPTQRSENP